MSSGQIGKAPDSGSGKCRFESYLDSQAKIGFPIFFYLYHINKNSYFLSETTSPLRLNKTIKLCKIINIVLKILLIETNMKNKWYYI